MSFDSVFDRYTPLPTSKSPAKRYLPFPSAYEKKVEEAQAIVAQADALSLPYTIVAEALEELDLPNDSTLSIEGSTIRAEFTVLCTNSTVELKEWTSKVGAALAKAGLHKDGIPSLRKSEWFPQFVYTWKLNKDQAVRFEFVLPAKEGLVDLWIEKRVVPTTNTLFHYRSKKTSPGDLQLDEGGERVKIIPFEPISPINYEAFNKCVSESITEAFGYGAPIVRMDVDVT